MSGVERNIIKATFPIPSYSFEYNSSPYVTLTVPFFTVLFYSAVVELASELSQSLSFRSGFMFWKTTGLLI